MHPDIYIYIYISVCVRVLHAYTYIIHLSVYVRIGRGDVCVHQCAMGDGSAAFACVAGSCCGLGLKPKPETVRAVPVGVDRVRLRRADVPVGVGVQREYRRVEHRGRHHFGRGMRRSLPGGAHYGGRARRGFGAARPVVRVRVRTRAGTRLRGASGVGTAGRRGGSMHASFYIYICACLCAPRLHLHYPFICICENRSGLCMRAPVCDGDGSAVCARVGGLVLQARP
jgi:hypothetical protein